MRDKRPNILLIFPDQHRGDWLQFNEKLPLKTPNLVRLAKNGIRFTNAICPSPLCSPSRSCLASGLEYDHCKIRNNGQCHPKDETSFYKILRDSGYHTMGCGKFDLNKPTYTYGVDGKQMVNGVSYLDIWGFSEGIDNGGKHNGIRGYLTKRTGPYLQYLKEKGLAKKFVRDMNFQNNYKRKRTTPLSDEDYADNYIGRNALKLLNDAPKDKPWFIQVNFNGPHEPMDVTKSMRDKWKDIVFPMPNGNKLFKSKENTRIRQNYAAMIENLDRWVGIFIEELKKRGEFENTIIVYSSDHGDMLGDHDMVAKSVPFHPAVNVPLIISGPGIKKNTVINKVVETLDLGGTFLHFAGLNAPQSMDTKSLKQVLSDDKKKIEDTDFPRSHATSGLESWRLVYDGRYKLITGIFKKSKHKLKTDQKKKEILKDPFYLYDLQEDPFENSNIAEEKPDIVEKMMELIPQGPIARPNGINF